GDHGRPLEGDRDEVALGPRAGRGRGRWSGGADHGHRPAEAPGARGDTGRPRLGRRGRQGDRRPPRLAEAGLMAAGTIWVVAEMNTDGTLAKSSTEVATLARTLAEAAGGKAAGILIAADPKAAADELAGYVPRVVAVAEPAADGNAWAQIA